MPSQFKIATNNGDNPGYYELPSLKFTQTLFGTAINHRNVMSWESSNNRVH